MMYAVADGDAAAATRWHTKGDEWQHTKGDAAATCKVAVNGDSRANNNQSNFEVNNQSKKNSLAMRSHRCC